MIYSWCLKELLYWRQRDVNYAFARERFQALNNTKRSTFLFNIRNRLVDITPKPEGVNDGPVQRAQVYRDFLQQTVDAFSLDLDVSLIIDLDDGGLELAELPVFVFQKPTGSKSVLLPDIDFLSFNFYTPHPQYNDRIGYDEKSISAIFVGSSSGGFVTGDSIASGAHPRIRSALFFRGNPKVHFHVPVVVQFDSPETKSYLADRGIGLGNRIEWPDQFRHRFLISVDGNGATCSRVAISLLSNGVLLKYASPHQLYYFQSLTPWLHYIPIENDADVSSILAFEERSPGYFEMIAQEAKFFAETYLTRHQAMKYTAWLLQMYAGIFSDEESGVQPIKHLPPQSSKLVTGFKFGILAHVKDKGDVWSLGSDWANSPGSDRWIEGFLVEPHEGIRRSQLRYQAILQGDLISEWTASGEFCGSRGQNRPIIGIRFELLGSAVDAVRLFYEGRFLDGSSSGLVAMGELCQSPTGEPLESFRIIIEAM